MGKRKWRKLRAGARRIAEGQRRGERLEQYAKRVAALKAGAPKIEAQDPILKDFYKSAVWLRLSYDVKIERGRRCECCGTTPEAGTRIITDHIKPIRKYWHLRLERSNLQILCEECNLGKGTRDETDFRQRAEEIPEGLPQMMIDQLTPPDGFLQ